MKILFVTDLSHLPQHAGGCQSLIHELALELRALGHEPAVLAPLHPGDFLGLRTRAAMKLRRCSTVCDHGLGYPTYRRWTVAGDLSEPLRDIAPDAVVVMARAAAAIGAEVRRLDLPALLYFQDVETDQLGGDLSRLEGAAFASNSRFTAERYREAFGIDSAIIPPLVRPERYRTQTTRSNVTMINPHPLKGGPLALDIAEACPEIPFSLVCCWVLTPSDRRWLQSRIRALPNVRLRPRTRDMRRVYGRARILLAPSRWEEAWGRVATEAHLSGVPVVAADRGGLRESVGPGGVLLPPDAPVEAWANAVRRLWSDADIYAAKSAAALTYAAREALAPRRLAGDLVASIGEAIRLGATAPAAGQMTAPPPMLAAI